MPGVFLIPSLELQCNLRFHTNGRKLASACFCGGACVCVHIRLCMHMCACMCACVQACDWQTDRLIRRLRSAVVDCASRYLASSCANVHACCASQALRPIRPKAAPASEFIIYWRISPILWLQLLHSLRTGWMRWRLSVRRPCRLWRLLAQQVASNTLCQQRPCTLNTQLLRS